jgi:hypothetical protein
VVRTLLDLICLYRPQPLGAGIRDPHRPGEECQGHRRIAISGPADDGEGSMASAYNDSSAEPDTVVLIHGLWLTPRCWELWVGHYADAGFHVVTPAWPGMEIEVEARATPARPRRRIRRCHAVLGAGPTALAGRDRQPATAVADAGRLPLSPRAPAHDRRRRRPHGPGSAVPRERQALSLVELDHRLPRVPRPIALHDRCAGWEDLADYALDWAVAHTRAEADRSRPSP